MESAPHWPIHKRNAPEKWNGKVGKRLQGGRYTLISTKKLLHYNNAHIVVRKNEHFSIMKAMVRTISKTFD